MCQGSLTFVIVLVMYSQGSGKGGCHVWQHDTQNIGAVSNLVMQVYEYAHHRTFRGVHTRNASLQVFTYALLPLHGFLCILPGIPSLTADGHTLSLDEDAFQIF